MSKSSSSPIDARLRQRSGSSKRINTVDKIAPPFSPIHKNMNTLTPPIHFSYISTRAKNCLRVGVGSPRACGYNSIASRIPPGGTLTLERCPRGNGSKKKRKLMKNRCENRRFLMAQNHVWRYTLRLFHTLAFFEKGRKIDAKGEPKSHAFWSKNGIWALPGRLILPFC